MDGFSDLELAVLNACMIGWWRPVSGGGCMHVYSCNGLRYPSSVAGSLSTIHATVISYIQGLCINSNVVVSNSYR